MAPSKSGSVRFTKGCNRWRNTTTKYFFIKIVALTSMWFALFGTFSLFRSTVYNEFNNTLLDNLNPALQVETVRRGEIDRLSIHQDEGVNGFKIIFIVGPAMSSDYAEGKTFDSVKILKIFHSLLEANYDVTTNLDVLVYPGQPSILINTIWNGNDFIPSLKWAHGTMHIRYFPSSTGLIKDAWNPPYFSNETVAIVDTRFIQDVEVKWYEFFKHANQYHHRHDVIAISSSSPYHHIQIDNSSTELSIWDRNLLLWPGVLDDTILYFHSASMWRQFIIWLDRQKADWYLWPTMIKARSKKDEPRWRLFNSTVTAPWQLWLSRFSVEHNVFVMYPRDRETYQSILNQQKHGGLPNDIPVYTLDGSFVDNSRRSRISAKTVHSIIEFSKTHGKRVTFTFVNGIYVQMALSWLCNVNVGGFRPPGIVWVATDDDAYDKLKTVDGTHAVRAHEINGARKGTRFGTIGYWLLMLERTTLIRDVLNEGSTVFLFEVDQVWLRDPLPFVERLFYSSPGLELVGSLDEGREIGGNFLILKPTLTVRKVYHEICRRFENAYNAQLKRETGSVSNSLIDNDQSLLTKLILYEEPFRSKYPILFRALDMELFACGKWYFGNIPRYNTSKARSPILINNNWVQGVSTKIERMKKFGHWFLSDNDTCNETAVRNAFSLNERRAGSLEKSNKITVPQTVTGEDVAANLSLLKSVIHLS